MREQYHRRRDLVVRRFNEIGLKCHSPRGSFYAFPDVTRHGPAPRRTLRSACSSRRRSPSSPGLAFGENGTGHVRACFATSYEQLIDACDRMDRFVNGAKK